MSGTEAVSLPTRAALRVVLALVLGLVRLRELCEVVVLDPHRVTLDERLQCSRVAGTRVVGLLLQLLQVEVLVLEHVRQLVRDGDAVLGVERRAAYDDLLVVGS